MIAPYYRETWRKKNTVHSLLLFTSKCGYIWGTLVLHFSKATSQDAFGKMDNNKEWILLIKFLFFVFIYFFIFILISIFFYNYKNHNYNYFIGDWVLGIGDWGLGIGPNPQSPIPNPQSPIPIYLFNNTQNLIIFILIFNFI